MTYVSVDIEADGPIPGDYSMISFGAVVVEPALDRTFSGRCKPISEQWVPEALAVSGHTREATLAFPDAASGAPRPRAHRVQGGRPRWLAARARWRAERSWERLRTRAPVAVDRGGPRSTDAGDTTPPRPTAPQRADHRAHRAAGGAPERGGPLSRHAWATLQLAHLAYPAHCHAKRQNMAIDRRRR